MTTPSAAKTSFDEICLVDSLFPGWYHTRTLVSFFSPFSPFSRKKEMRDWGGQSDPSCERRGRERGGVRKRSGGPMRAAGFRFRPHQLVLDAAG